MGAARVGIKGRSAAGMGWDRAGTNVASRRPRTANDTNRGERVRRARAARAGGLGARGWADQITKKGPWIDGLPVVARQDGDRPTHCAKKNRYSKIAIQKCQIAIQKSDVATQISTDPYKNTEKHREKVTKLPIAPCPSNPLGSAKTDQLEQLNSGIPYVSSILAEAHSAR